MTRVYNGISTPIGWFHGASKSALICILLAALLSCMSPENAWERARAEDTEEAYAEFLGNFGDSEFAGKARERLIYLQDWDAALSGDTSSAYSTFLERHPEADHSKEAEYRRDFRTAVEIDSFDAFVSFLAAYPESLAPEGLWEDAEAAAWEKALEANRPEPFSRFAAAVPQSKLAAEAANRSRLIDLEVVEFAKARSGCSDSPHLAGVILKLVARWSDISIGIGAEDVKVSLRGGGSVDVAWILPLDESGADWKRPRAGQMCGGGASMSIGESLPRWGYIGQNAILPVDDYTLEVNFTEKGSWVKLGFLFETAPEHIEEVELLHEYRIAPGEKS